MEGLEDSHAFSKLCDPLDSLFSDFKDEIAVPYRELQQFIELYYLQNWSET